MGMKPREKPAMFRTNGGDEYDFEGLNPPPSLIICPYKKIPCQECNGKGFVNQHWAAGGGRIGYRSWMAMCSSCRRRAGAMAGIDEMLKLLKKNVAPEQFRFEIEGEIWDPDKKRYDHTALKEKADEQP
jgi:hypothetical protein